MNKQALLALLGALVFGLGACGGDATPVSNSSSETAVGSVTGFGSVIVAGTRYADGQAKVSEEIAAGVTNDLSLESVELGMQISVTASDDQAEAIEIQTTLVATIDSVQADGFSAAGQQVRVTPDTLYSGTTGLVELSAGTRIAVHGTRDADDVIIASRVSVRAPESEALLRIVGVIRDLDQNQQTFRLGGLTVDYSGDPRILPASAELANGLGVIAFGELQAGARVLQVSGLRVLDSEFVAGRRIRVAGLIRDLDPQALTFRLHYATIDASAARFPSGTPADLANGRRARLVGTVRLASNGERIIAADTVWVGGSEDDLATVAGSIRNFVSAGSFTIRGVPIDASGAAVRFINGTADNLANGVFLRVIGAPDGEKVTATSIEFFASETDRQRSVAGLIRNSDAGSQTLQIFDVRVRLVDSTRIILGNGTPTTAAAIQNGTWAVATGQFRSGQLVADEIRIRQGGTVVIDQVEGIVYRIDASEGRFWLNGIAVRVGGGLTGSVAFSTLRAGHRVRVSGEWVNGELVITSIIKV